MLQSKLLPWRSRLIRKHHLPVWGHGFGAAWTRLPLTKCCFQLTVPHWSTWKEKVESLSFLLNGQVFPWHKNPSHRPIWFANGNPYGEPKRKTMGGNGRGKLMTLSAPQMVTPTPLTPGNCLKLPYSIRTKNLENLCTSSKFDRSLPQDKVQEKGQRLFDTYPGRKMFYHNTEQRFNSHHRTDMKEHLNFAITFYIFDTNKKITQRSAIKIIINLVW